MFRSREKVEGCDGVYMDVAQHEGSYQFRGILWACERSVSGVKAASRSNLFL